MSISKQLYLLFFAITTISISFGQQSMAEKKTMFNNLLSQAKKETQYAKKKQLLESATYFAKKQNLPVLQLAGARASLKFYYRNKKWKKFNKTKEYCLSLSKKLQDSMALARTHEYTAAYYRNKFKPDSAFYHYTKSFRIYNGMKDSLNAGYTLLNLAIIQKNTKDYVASEYKSLLALRYLTNKKKPRYNSSIYNNLGLVYYKLKNYPKAIEYYTKSLKTRKKLGIPILVIQTLNNIGLLYKQKGDYALALTYFNQALSHENELKKHNNSYAKLTDNKAHTLFLMQANNPKSLMLMEEALQIRQGLNDLDGITISNIHLAEYYIANKDTIKALAHTKKAEAIAKQIKNKRDYLKAMEMLIEVSPATKSKEVFKTYAKLRDSIEIAIKNQNESFAKIELQTQEKEAEIVLHQNRNNTLHRNIWLLIGFLFIVAIILFFIGGKNMAYQKETLANKEEINNQQLLIHALKEEPIQVTPENKAAFYETLKTKYQLTKENLDFWNVYIKDLTEKEKIELLCISKHAYKKRRIALKKKIMLKRPLNSEVFSTKVARRIYKDEEALLVVKENNS